MDSEGCIRAYLSAYVQNGGVHLILGDQLKRRINLKSNLSYTMKNCLLATITLLMMVMVQLSVLAQTSFSRGDNPNMAKFNVLPLVGGKFAFEYERLLTGRVSVGGSISVRPRMGIPFSSTVKSYIDEEEVNRFIDEFKSSNFSFTPEVRFYLSSKGGFRGFYLAPYVKYTSYGITLPYDFDMYVQHEGEEFYDRTETIPISGNMRSFTGGLSLGTSFKLASNIYLDWRIIGPGYGVASGKVSGKMALNADEQTSLRDGLDELSYELEDLALGIKIDHDVHSEGADIIVQRSPWAGLRTGLSIGYRF